MTLKLATSLDGKVATAAGESQWISGPEARALVHRWRADSDAVAVGIGTALADDPRLTARDLPGPVRQPLRVVFDSGGAAAARLEARPRRPGEVPVLVVAGPGAPPERVRALRAAGRRGARAGARAIRRGAIAAALEELGRREVQIAAWSRAAPGWPRPSSAPAPSTASPGSWRRSCSAAPRRPGRWPTWSRRTCADAPRLVGVEVMRVGEDLVLTGRLKPLPSGPQ